MLVTQWLVLRAPLRRRYDFWNPELRRGYAQDTQRTDSLFTLCSGLTPAEHVPCNP